MITWGKLGLSISRESYHKNAKSLCMSEWVCVCVCSATATLYVILREIALNPPNLLISLLTDAPCVLFFCFMSFVLSYFPLVLINKLLF